MRILYLGPPEGRDVMLALVPQDVTVEVALSPAEVASRIAECDAIVDAYMKVPFPADVLQRAKKLRVFVTATTGADHVDSAELASRGIPLLTLKGQVDVLRNLTPAAELSWLLLQACARNLRGAVEHVLGGGWDRNEFPGMMLRGRTIGIIGCGRIGQWMGRYAEAFGMRRLGYDPVLASWPEHIERVELDALLGSSDAITVHVPLSTETVGLLGRSQITRMKEGVILVNTSRGAVIDQTALLDGLRTGRIGAAGLDVLEGEPDTKDHPLVQYARENANLIITPHIGGYSPDAIREVVAFSCRRALGHLGAA